MKEIVAKRYAKALIQLGREDGQYTRYGQELKGFQELLEASGELKAVMENPIYNKDQKKLLFNAFNTKLQLSPVVVAFILLLIDKRRLGYFNDIVRAYEKLVDEVSGRTRARVTSAVPLSEASVRTIQQRLAAVTGKEVVVSVQEDAGLIGGVVAQIGDVIYDGSLRTQLEMIKETLMKG